MRKEEIFQLMLLPGHLVYRVFGSHMPVVSWKRSTAALPKTCTGTEKIMPLGFARAEEPKRCEHRLKLVIKPTPEDGWYVIQQNGLLKSYLQVCVIRIIMLCTS